MINSNAHPKETGYIYVFATGLLGNLALAILKLSVGLFGYSKLVLMDGIFSFINAVILSFTWQGDRLEKREFNERYPYGYGKVIFLTMSVAGLVVLIIAIYMFFYSLTGMGWLEIHRSHSGAMMVTLISIIANEVLYRYLMEKSKGHLNGVIAWNALNNRIDVLVSSLILFFIVVVVVLRLFAISIVGILAFGVINFNNLMSKSSISILFFPPNTSTFFLNFLSAEFSSKKNE